MEREDDEYILSRGGRIFPVVWSSWGRINTTASLQTNTTHIQLSILHRCNRLLPGSTAHFTVAVTYPGAGGGKQRRRNTETEIGQAHLLQYTESPKNGYRGVGPDFTGSNLISGACNCGIFYKCM